MRWYVAQTMGWVILGLVVTMGLLAVVVGSGWMVLGVNGGGDFGPYYTYTTFHSDNGSMLKIAFLLLAVGCGLLGYVTWELTFYGIMVLDDILQYIDERIAYQTPWLHEKAYALISILPLL